MQFRISVSSNNLPCLFARRVQHRVRSPKLAPLCGTSQLGFPLVPTSRGAATMGESARHRGEGDLAARRGKGRGQAPVGTLPLPCAGTLPSDGSLPESFHDVKANTDINHDF